MLCGPSFGFSHQAADTLLIPTGRLHYQFIPTMQEDRLRSLMEKFGQPMREQPLLPTFYGLI
jgi:hypothetical protein